ncbi:metal-sulfur cluster assembly factor [Bifidobacterium boum]|uniref:Metal-sulfur cluster assembly factor n=1 Tax=Bifidobacterium boum TaxID=78343 RepID=A0A848D531_9BIFI|nr:metal-sulfur cluster assembly factor [Bifidobacterium boum]MCF2561062.1 metal-sulfur cluster assembly factor [Bifidobacterium boum]NMF03124.1 metal-sulfur cluster assembly factor [Bifidobacterium boum]
MTDQGNLVPEPESTIFDTVSQALGNDNAARKVMANPQLLGALGTPAEDTSADPTQSGGVSQDNRCACGKHSKQECQHDGDENNDNDIPLVAVDDIGRATAQDVKEALHQVIDPELGIDVIDLGLVYGIEIDNLGRAIITMTLTTPACPLTELIEDECASTLAGLVEEFRIDWTWQPRWTVDKITPEGREQLAAIGFNLDAMPQY